MSDPPTLEEKILVVLRAARKRLRPAAEHNVGINAQTAQEVDRLLAAAERELLEQTESDERPVSGRLVRETDK